MRRIRNKLLLYVMLGQIFFFSYLFLTRPLEICAAPKQPSATTPEKITTGEEAARFYLQGKYKEALQIWEKLAEEGDAGAMNNLGVLYDRGQGVDPDPGRALHWFALSANAEDPAGMSNYARLLELGRGIDRNPDEAARWFDKAARKGQAEAQYNLGLMYETGRGVAPDYRAAAAWYSRAAAQQQTEALARLGHFYRLGRGVEKNTARASLLLYAAAMNGQKDAIRELAEMATPLTSSVMLFGQELDKTDRTALRKALKSAGVLQERQNDAFICDMYNVRKAVPGADKMSACYGPGKSAPLAFLKIDYIAKDKKTADRIVNMVEERFGKPSAGEGEDARLWNLGSVVVATQFVPTHGQMSLMYMIPRVYYLTRTN